MVGCAEAGTAGVKDLIHSHYLPDISIIRDYSMLIDTHAHVQFDAFNDDRDEVLRRSAEQDVWMINIGTQKSTSERAILLTRGREGLFAAVGLHPNHLEPDAYHNHKESNSPSYEEFDESFFRQLAADSKVVAIGETGLDYYRMKHEAGSVKYEEIKEKQREVFKKHIELALELDKPLIIHCRSAHSDCISILESCSRNIRDNSSDIRAINGVMHSFGGTVEDARRYRAMGFKIAFNGIITFSQDYDEVVRDTPLEDLLIETDCPYLTPVPYRGKRNEPSYVRYVAARIAEIKGMSFGEVAAATTANARELFGI